MLPTPRMGWSTSQPRNSLALRVCKASGTKTTRYVMTIISKFVSRSWRNAIAELTKGTSWLEEIPDRPYTVIYTECDEGKLTVRNFGETIFVAPLEIGNSRDYIPACFLKKLAGKRVQREVIPQTSWLETAHLIGP